MESLCLLNPPLAEVDQHLKANRFFWLDLTSPDKQTVDRLAQLLSLHPLTVEDLQSFKSLPKFEEYPGYDFVVVHGATLGTDTAEPELHEVHLLVTGDCVVTIHDEGLTEFDALRSRYDKQPMRSEQMLIYRILDAIASTYFPVLAQIDDQIDEIEERVMADPSEQMLRAIFTLKRQLVTMRRVVTPMRDVFARNVERIADLPGMEQDDRLYFRDLYDTMIRVADLVDSYRDLLAGATDLYLSTVANRQGEINKQLTIIATIFLPLTFLTGFFGQNFSFLTNHILNSTTSFLGLGLGLLVVSVGGFVIYFRTRRWI